MGLIDKIPEANISKPLTKERFREYCDWMKKEFKREHKEKRKLRMYMDLDTAKLLYEQGMLKDYLNMYEVLCGSNTADYIEEKINNNE